MPLELWTTPRTWQTGELIGQTIMNAHVRDNTRHLLPGTLINSASADINTTYSTTSTTFVSMEHNSILVTGRNYGSAVFVMMGPFAIEATVGNQASLNISVDGSHPLSYVYITPQAGKTYAFLTARFALAAGVHTYRPTWRSIGGGTISLLPYHIIQMVIWEAQG